MNTYEDKLKRLNTVIALKEPDRVPFAPKTSLYFCNYEEEKINTFSVMKDYRLAKPGLKDFVERYDPDLLWPPALYPYDPLEILGANMIRLPGPEHNLPLTSSFQYVDDTYMQDDEFDQFLTDPTHYTLTKILPKKYKNLKPLEKLAFNNIYDLSFIMDLGPFDDDDVVRALMDLIKAGGYVRKRQKQGAEIRKYIEEDCGCPTRGATICAPFDAYADSLRGLVRAVLDVVEYPEETLACVERIYDLYVPRTIELAKRMGERLVFIPLHAGVDQFMSPENYEKFYWPTLKKTMLAIIDAGMTPYVFCEGNYNTRLEVISDIPKGKVIYMFETADMKRVKATVGKVACICGNFSTVSLVAGTPEKVERETKELLDICAPGGGFIMDCSLIIDNANPANLAAWKEATLKYGSY